MAVLLAATLEFTPPTPGALLRPYFDDANAVAAPGKLPAFIALGGQFGLLESGSIAD